MTRKILLFAALILSSFQLQASHLFGGEITWQCIKSGINQGKYVFTLKVYRDCNGIPYSPKPSITVYSTTAVAANYPSTWSIPLNAAVATDISPSFCPNNCNTGGPGTVQEFVQTSPPTTLSGIPPATGWVFEVDDCCRNILANMTGSGFTIRALMFPYNSTNTNPCFDSSPYFAEKPSTYICTGYPFTYNPNAIDPEFDEIVYSWASCLEQPSTTPPSPFSAPIIPFTSPYTVTNQLPGNPTINAQSGEIKYFPTSLGNNNYATCIKATAYKCGIKVSEIFRDYGVTLTSNCTLSNTGVSNTPPDVNAPFKDPVTGLFTLYADTVFAGDTVNFFLNATDFEIGTSNAPNNFNLQSVLFSASGTQFGAGFTSSTNGCLIPPCATTNPALPTPYVQGGVGVAFTWPVKCPHAGGFDTVCVTPNPTYNFVIKAQDNYCPAPAIQVGTISITVKYPAKLLPPKIRCADVQNLAGDVKLSWSLPAPIDTHYTFTQYEIYGSLTGTVGSWVKLDSVYGNLNKYLQTEQTVTGAQLTTLLGTHAQNDSLYFQMFTRCGCDSDSISIGSNIVKSMRPSLLNGAGGVQVNWTPVHTPPLASNWPFYEVWKEFPIGTWARIATLPINTTIYIDPTTLNLCNDSITYRIVAKDTIASPNMCESWSAYNGIRIQNVLSAQINPSGPVTICSGTSTTLTALPASGGGANYTYLWSANAGNAVTQAVSVSNAGIYSVIVTQVPSGCKDTVFVTVNVNALPTVALTGTASICQGSNTNLTLTFTGTSPWTYNYTANGVAVGSASTSTNPFIISVAPSTTTTYAITAISNVLCTGVPPVATAIVTVHPKPTAALSGTQTICAGASASLIFNFTGTGPWTPSYNVPGGGVVNLPATNSNPYNFSVTPVANFNYTPSAITDQFCTGTVSGGANITVVPLPTATLSTATPALCAGQGGTITVTFTGQGPWTYSYKDLTTNITYGPLVSATNSTTINVTPVSTTNYVLIGNVVGANNCSAPANGALVQVLVRPLPTANISGTTAICNGANTSLPIALTGTGPYIINYVTIPASGPHVLNSVGNATSFNVNPTVTTSYIVTSVQDAYCTRNSVNDTVVVTVHPLPTATISTPTPNICQGTQGTLSVSFTGTGPWVTSIPGVGNINTSTNPYTVSVGPVGTTSYNLALTVTDAHCTGNSVGTANINVIPTPTAALSGNNTICAGQSTNLTINFTGQAPFVYNYWTGSGTPVSGNTASNSVTIPVSPPVGNTTYTLTGTFTGNGCSGSIGGSAAITVRPLPTSAITTSNDSICNGGNTNVIFNFTGTGPYTYAYSINGISQGTFNSAGNSAAVNVSPIATATYTITNVTDALCSNSAVHNTVVTVIPLPTATIATTTPSLCLGQNGGIIISFTGYGPFSTSYTTGGPNIPVNTASSSTAIVVTPIANTTYTLAGNVTGLLGCTQAVSNAPAQIVVHPLPTATIVNNSVICAGQQTSFNINFTGTAPFNYSYTATNGVAGGSGTASSNPVTINVTPGTSTTYSLGTVSDNFCNATSLNGAAIVTVHPLPTAAITGTATICDGSQTNLSIAFTGSAPFNYSYSYGSTTTSGTTSTNPFVFAVNPNATTTYHVTAVSDVHCTGIAPAQTAVVTVTPIPTAQIAGTTAICNGQATNLNFTFTGQAPYSYSYKDGNGNTFGPFTSNTASASASVSPTSTTTYTLTSSVTGNGCSGGTSGSAIVTVHPLPTAVVSTNSTICAGGQTSFNINFTGTGPFNYTWSGTNGGGSGTAVSNSNSVSINITPSQTSTYTVTAISDANCTGNSMTGSAVVTVHPLPTATLSATPSICKGQTANLTISFTGTGPFNYSYSSNPGGAQGSFTSNTNSVTVPVTPITNTSYTITATSDANCTAGVLPASANVVVHDLPTAAITGTNAICIGQSSNLIFNFVGTAPFTYQYSYGTTTSPTLVSNTNSATLSVSPTSSTSYSLVSVNDAYCTGSVSGNALVTVNPLPTPSITGVSAVCDGNSSTLTVNPVYPQYSWNTTATTQNISVNQTNTYSVTVTDVNGCVNSTSFQFTVNPVPVVSFINDTSLSCEVPNIHFTNTSTNIDPGATFLWNFGDTSANVISNQYNPSHIYQLPGNYAVSLTITNPSGCNSSLVQNTPIMFFPLPVAKFKADPNFASVFNSKVSFTDLSAYAVTWHWDFGNGTTADNNPNPLFYFDEIGDYQVTLTITNIAGCVDQTKEMVSVTPFYIPNAFTPNSDGRNDQFFNPGYALDVASYTFMIWNRWGQKVFETQDYNSTWNGKDTGGHDAPQGTYVYSLAVKGHSGKDYNFNGTVTLVR